MTSLNSRSRFSWMLGLAGLVGVTMACGDGSSGTVDLPFESSTAVQNLSADEQGQICDLVIDATVDMMMPHLCNVSAVAASSFSEGNGGMSCEQFRSLCQDALNKSSGQALEMAKSQASCQLTAVEQCEATVEQVEQCLTTMLQATDAVLAKITCGSSMDLQSMQTELQGAAMQSLDECKPVAQSCSGLSFSPASL